MPTYIMFICEKMLDESTVAAYWSKGPPTIVGRPINMLTSNGRHLTLEGPEVNGVASVWLKDARAWYETPGQQEAAQRQFDSWLADMEYCDRF